MLVTALLPILAQAAPLPSIEQDRLTVCLAEARTDPATAMVTASTWLASVSGAERSYPQQCLGMAYVSLLRWDAAEQSFLAAREARTEDDHAGRAKLAAMAGNAALADRRREAALAALDLALADAEAAGDAEMAGIASLDRARALVGLGREREAFAALERARRDVPQNSDAWLLSATLSRRGGVLEIAQAQIETAAGLAPDDPAIGLEAGVIAILSGHNNAARESWESVIRLAPDSREAETARNYLTQIEEAQD